MQQSDKSILVKFGRGGIGQHSTSNFFSSIRPEHTEYGYYGKRKYRSTVYTRRIRKLFTSQFK